MLGGVLLLAIVVPELLHRHLAGLFGWSIYSRFQDFDKVEILAAIAALLAGHLSLQKISSLPLAGDKSAILPAFVLSFSGVAAILGLILRDFGRYHLVTAFLIGTTWYFLLSIMRARVSMPRLAIVGGLSAQDELHDTNVDWIALIRPRLPRDVAGIVFDKTRLLEPKFERLFARGAATDTGL